MPNSISANERNFFAPRAHYIQLIPPLKAKERFLTLSKDNVNSRRKAMVLGGKKARVVGREACGAGRAALGYNCIIDNVTHAPQASNGISWRDAADWIVCRMPIRYLLRSREIRSKETRRKANEERENDDPFFFPFFFQ